VTKLISGKELFESFGNIRSSLDGLTAIATGVCPTCHQRTRYETRAGRLLHRILRRLEPLAGRAK
jgi:hypothetical protein